MDQNNLYIKILECALDIVEIEIVKISIKHSLLADLTEGRLGNIKIAIDNVSSLGLEIKRKISTKPSVLSKLFILEKSYNRELNSLYYYKILAKKIRNRIKDLRKL